MTTTLAFLGNFGTSNLGNEFTLRAVLQGARQHLPGARLHCVCPDPVQAARTHAVSASRMSYRNDPAFAARGASRHRHPLARFLRRLFLRLPLEALEWREAFRTLRGVDMLIMPGTGMLGDFGIRPLDLHYQILKWSTVARLRGCRVLFVSVGAGPIAHPLSRWIVRLAVGRAAYRSYRDHFSRRYVAGIGCDASRDAVYPDLAFSLSPPPARPAEAVRPRRVIGLGLMDYYGRSWSAESGEPIFRDYIGTLAAFATWLLRRGHAVRLLVGDLAYDRRARTDLRALLERNGVGGEPGQVLDDPVTSLDDLWTQIAETDAVVATRFHNVLLALMAGKPVLALSYHEKVRSLMAEADLAEYCEDVDTLDLDRLTARFLRLEAEEARVRASIQRKTEEYRARLDEQYGRIFTTR
jgi:polysaccharide pyruvyl transferase WcaK-like protein